MAPSVSPESCSTTSATLNENLAGTAPRCWGFLLVEHQGPWLAEPLDSLGEAGAQVGVAAENAALRPGLIRRFDREGVTTVGHLVYISVPDEGGILISRRFDSLADLDVYDIEDATEMARDGEVPPGWSASEPILTVCTHAKRDTCCATQGRPLIEAVHRIAPEMVWETTHLGGHRFAATAATLPTGVVYGRLTPQDAPELVEATRNGNLLVERMRGRTNLSPASQFAEVEVRRQAVAAREGAVVLLDEVESRIENGTRSVTEWEVNGTAWTVVIDTHPGKQAGVTPRKVSCAGTKEESPDVFVVVSIHTEGTNRTAAQWDDRHRGSAPTDPNSTVLHEVSQLASGTALDIGAGTGRHALMLAKEGWQVTAVDFSAEAISTIQQAAQDHDLTLRTIHADATRWEPTDGARYDLILMSFVQLPEAFARALRWLAPGGRLIVVGHATRNLTDGVGGPSDPRLLHDPIDLAARATGARLRVLRAGEVERSTDQGTAIDAVLVAMNPAVVLNPATAEAAHAVME